MQVRQLELTDCTTEAVPGKWGDKELDSRDKVVCVSIY